MKKTKKNLALIQATNTFNWFVGREPNRRQPRVQLP